MAKTSTKGPVPSTRWTDVVSVASEFEEGSASLALRGRALFHQRQRLAHRRLSGESIPEFRDVYLGLRQEEEEIRFRLLQLENEWRTAPRIYSRPRTVECSKSVLRLRRWRIVLMITVLLAIFVALVLGG